VQLRQRSVLPSLREKIFKRVTGVGANDLYRFTFTWFAGLAGCDTV